jgi:very-short-patch-repair endonuclease
LSIDAIGVITGPGSFTGIRMGLAYAKGLAMGLKIPLVGMNVFEVAERKFPSVEGCPEGAGWLVKQAQPMPRNLKNYNLLPFEPRLAGRAKELRKAGSLPEALFWKEIRNKKLNGLDFDRQKVIGNYIVDFFCAEKMLVIEIDDKATHDLKVVRDAKRDEYLTGLGLTVIRIDAGAVLRNPGELCASLTNHPACCAGTPPQRGTYALPSDRGDFYTFDGKDFGISATLPPDARLIENWDLAPAIDIVAEKLRTTNHEPRTTIIPLYIRPSYVG